MAALTPARIQALEDVLAGKVQVKFGRAKRQFILEGELYPPSQIPYNALFAEQYISWEALRAFPNRAKVVLTEKGRQTLSDPAEEATA